MGCLPVEKLGIFLNLGARLNLGHLTPLSLIFFGFVKEDIPHDKDVNPGHTSYFASSFHVPNDTCLLQIHFF